MKKTQRHPSVNSRNLRQVKKRQSPMRKKNFTKVYLAFVFLLVILLSIFTLFLFRQSHFGSNTTIDGVNCSWLTPEQAYNKLNEQLENKNISFLFFDTQYDFCGSSFNLKLPSTTELEKFLEEQKANRKSDFSSTLFSLDESKVHAILKSIPNLNTANMIHSKDAEIILVDNLLTINPEVAGNYIDFSEAYDLAFSSLQCGHTIVDFRSITDYIATVNSFDLQEKVNTINQILRTSISFLLLSLMKMVLMKLM